MKIQRQVTEPTNDKSEEEDLHMKPVEFEGHGRLGPLGLNGLRSSCTLLRRPPEPEEKHEATDAYAGCP